MAISRSQMKRQLYSIGGGAIKGTDAGNGREGFFRPVFGGPKQNHPLAIGTGGMGPIQLGGFGPRQPRQLPMGVLPQGGEQAVYPRLGDLRSGVSSAEQELQQINQSIDQVQSDLGSPTGGEFGDFSSIINPIRPGVQGSSMSSIYSNNYIGDRGSEQSSPIGQIMGFGAGDPRLGAPVIPGNYFQTIMRGGAADGGMMGRQMYGLGSFVKKAVKGVTGAVKSIAKSDLGKAALLIGGGMYAGGLGPFAAAGRFGSIPGAGFASGIPSLIKGGVKALGLGVPAGGKPTLGQFGKVFALGSLGGAALEALTASGADEEELENIRDPETLRAYLRQGYLTLNPQAQPDEVEQFVEANTVEYRANGGRMGYAFGNPEQNAINAAGIMNLPLNQNPAGVTELDLRDSGGFIPPVGVKEKADDIPAMLSNNEFVFTADAVRGMGDGNVNKGAQRMYDMMKKLENGGRV
jgi:hypothetical protein